MNDSTPNNTASRIPEQSDFILYTDDNSDINVKVYLRNETLWLPQKKIAELFGVNVPAISKHLQNIYTERELDKSSTISILETVQNEGGRAVKRQVEIYNLDAILSIGYRVHSSKATQFRIWATQTLREYIIKGFVMNDERLKQGEATFGQDYFKDLLERVRSIRASERRIYQQITDIFAECSTDYNPKSKQTKDFYATVQNKFHYAVTGNTAAEIIYKNADSQKEKMGLETWKNAPAGRILKSDTKVAKNYLREEEIKKLERTIAGFFDYIENIIENRNSFTMAAFAESVNKFLSFNEYKVLDNLGNFSADEAKQKAFQEYDKFNRTQKINSDFDKMTKKIANKGNR